MQDRYIYKIDDNTWVASDKPPMNGFVMGLAVIALVIWGAFQWVSNLVMHPGCSEPPYEKGVWLCDTSEVVDYMQGMGINNDWQKTLYSLNSEGSITETVTWEDWSGNPYLLISSFSEQAGGAGEIFEMPFIDHLEIRFIVNGDEVASGSFDKADFAKDSNGFAPFGGDVIQNLSFHPDLNCEVKTWCGLNG
jgi:hypothetical protein